MFFAVESGIFEYKLSCSEEEFFFSTGKSVGASLQYLEKLQQAGAFACASIGLYLAVEDAVPEAAGRI